MRRLARLSLNALLQLTLAGLFLLPILFIILAAFHPAGEPLGAAIRPARPTLDQFDRLFMILPVGRLTLNSIRVIALAVPLTVLTASWAGFAMARLPRPAQRRWVLLSFMVLMVPGVAFWPARFLIYSRLGIIDTYWALIAPALMGTSPLFILMFYRAFRRIPGAVFDSARLDGAGMFALWGRIALPVARPTAFAVAMLSLIVYWGDFVSPLLYLSNADRYTLPVGLQMLEQLGRSDYPLLMAGALWSTIVPLALVLVGVIVLALTENRRTKDSLVISGSDSSRR